MKNTIICSIAVLSAALLAACTETTRIWPEEGESKAYVEVSSQKVIFDADGGNAVAGPDDVLRGQRLRLVP